MFGLGQRNSWYHKQKIRFLHESTGSIT
jgi:hypothetical protein